MAMTLIVIRQASYQLEAIVWMKVSITAWMQKSVFVEQRLHRHTRRLSGHSRNARNLFYFVIPTGLLNSKDS